MKLGVFLIGGYDDPTAAVAVARAVEAAGFESLWVADHIVIPRSYASVYPYDRGGRLPQAELPFPDPFVWLAYAAAQTTTLRLATGVLVLPQRQPLVVAKQAATLDRLSGGRLILGVGAGWLAEEFAALDVPFAERGRRLDEYVTALRALWRNEAASFAGAFVRFEAVVARPAPVRGAVPIVIGGHTEQAARRAGRLGDGFYPGRGRPEELARLVEVLREAARAAGRDPDAIELTAPLPRRPEAAQRLRESGFSRFLRPVPDVPLAELPEALVRLREECLALLG